MFKQACDTIMELCNLILTRGDNLTPQKAFPFLTKIDQTLHQELMQYSQNEEEIKVSITEHLLKYTTQYYDETPNTGGNPFDFDNTSHPLKQFQISFENEYLKKEFFKEESLSCEVPKAFKIVFELIQEKSNIYRDFELFYNAKERRFGEQIEKNNQAKIQETINNSTAEAIKKVEKAQKDAVKTAKMTATNTANKKAKELELKLSNKTAETSVTILGIFAGIVLTVVAGLFYSSSVLNNINSASLHKLILVSSIVGFVCFNIIALMFNYIDKFRNKDDKHNKTLDILGNDTKSEDKSSSADQADSADSAPSKRDEEKSFFDKLKDKIADHLFVICLDVILLLIMIFTAVLS